jgi:hypothetical protein
MARSLPILIRIHCWPPYSGRDADDGGPDQRTLQELLAVIVATPVIAALVVVAIPVASVAIPAPVTAIVPVVVILADLAPDLPPRLPPLPFDLTVAFSDLAPGTLTRFALAQLPGGLAFLAAYLLAALADFLPDFPAARGDRLRGHEANGRDGRGRDHRQARRTH